MLGIRRFVPIVIAVVGAALAALAVVLAATGVGRLATTASPDADEPPHEPSRADEPAAERWLVDHLARVRGMGHVIRAFDRFVWGGAMVGIALVSLLLGGAVVGWVLSTVDSDRGFARFDESAAEWGSSNADDVSTAALRTITQFGASGILIPAMAIVGLVVAYRHRRHDHPRWAVFGFLLTVGIGITNVNNGLKWMVDRDRPTVEHLAGSGGSSFPSGHSAAAAACWAAIALVASRRLPSGRRRWAAAGAASIAVAVAASRVLLGVHWLTDVIAGLVVGWTWFLLVALAFGGRLQRFGHAADEVRGRTVQPVSTEASATAIERPTAGGPIRQQRNASDEQTINA